MSSDARTGADGASGDGRAAADGASGDGRAAADGASGDARPLRPSTRARGFALAAARALAAAAPAFCAERGEGAFVDVATLVATAAALGDEAARARATAALARTVPAGLSLIDRSWYVAPPSSAAGTSRFLQRAAYAHLVDMEEVDGEAAPDELATKSAAELERALVALGLRRVALAFVGAPRAGLAQLCARLGEPAASQLVAEVRALRSASSEEVKAAQRALFGDEGEPAADDGRDRAHALFFRVGCGWLAPALAHDGDQLHRVAQRLPRPLGQTLLAAAATPSSLGERTAVRLCLGQALDRR